MADFKLTLPKAIHPALDRLVATGFFGTTVGDVALNLLLRGLTSLPPDLYTEPTRLVNAESVSPVERKPIERRVPVERAKVTKRAEVSRSIPTKKPSIPEEGTARRAIYDQVVAEPRRTPEIKRRLDSTVNLAHVNPSLSAMHKRGLISRHVVYDGRRKVISYSRPGGNDSGEKGGRVAVTKAEPPD